MHTVETPAGQDRPREVTDVAQPTAARRYSLGGSLDAGGTGGRFSVDRQVRVLVGVLILAGLLVPKLIFLPYLMGFGLIFAGITDTCGMAVLLARMPWNRRVGSSPACRR